MGAAYLIKFNCGFGYRDTALESIPSVGSLTLMRAKSINFYLLRFSFRDDELTSGSLFRTFVH